MKICTCSEASRELKCAPAPMGIECLSLRESCLYRQIVQDADLSDELRQTNIMAENARTDFEYLNSVRANLLKMVNEKK